MIKNLKQITVSTHIVYDVNENKIYYIGIGNAEEKVIINVGSKNFKKVDELLQNDNREIPKDLQNETHPQQTNQGETVPDSMANDNSVRGRGNRRTTN